MNISANSILKTAYKKYQRRNPGKKHITDISQKSGLSYSSVYGAILKDRTPSAELWLKIMNTLDAVEDKGKRSILINF